MIRGYSIRLPIGPLLFQAAILGAVWAYSGSKVVAGMFFAALALAAVQAYRLTR